MMGAAWVGLLLWSCAPSGAVRCPAFDELEIRDDLELMSADEIQVVQDVLDEFAAVVDRPGVCVGAVNFVDGPASIVDGRQFEGDFDPGGQIVRLSAQSADLELTLLHQLCHAWDVQRTADSAPGVAYSHRYAGVYDGIGEWSPSLHVDPTMERFAALCSGGVPGPSDTLFGDRCTTGVLSADDRDLLDAVYPGAGDVDLSTAPRGTVAVMGSRVPWPGRGSWIERQRAAAAGDWLWVLRTEEHYLWRPNINASVWVAAYHADDGGMPSVQVELNGTSFQAYAEPIVGHEAMLVPGTEGPDYRAMIVDTEGGVEEIVLPSAWKGSVRGRSVLEGRSVLWGPFDGDESDAALVRLSLESGETRVFGAPSDLPDGGSRRTRAVSWHGTDHLWVEFEVDTQKHYAEFAVADETWAPVRSFRVPEGSLLGGVSPPLPDGRHLAPFRVENWRVDPETGDYTGSPSSWMLSVFDPDGGWRVPEGRCPYEDWDVDGGVREYDLVHWGERVWSLDWTRTRVFEYAGIRADLIRVDVGDPVQDF